MKQYNVSAVFKDIKTLEAVRVVLAYLKEHDIRIKAFLAQVFIKEARRILRLK